MEKPYKCSVIGAGRLGSSLASYFEGCNMLQWVLARSDNSVQKIKNIIPRNRIIRQIDELIELPEIILIAVSDSNINLLDSQLSRLNIKGKVIAHCSGQKRTDELKECTKNGAYTASSHPYQTFYYNNPDALKNAAWGLEGDDRAISILSELIQDSGGKPFILSDQTKNKKALYHLSAVLASNATMAAYDYAHNLAKRSSIEAKEFLPPIINQTNKNFVTALEKGENLPISGPIARADMETIINHTLELKEYKSELIQYCLIGLFTAERALDSGIISKDFYKQVSEFFLKELKDYYF